jgi:hypothetical protein
MRTWFRWLGVVALVFLIGIQFVRPARTNPHTDPAGTLSAIMPITAEAAAVLDRSCRDCHSNDTRWPWYSNLAPVSWFVIDHVNHGRSHFNYSDWAKYDRGESQRLLKNTCSFARQETMPLSSYALMHRPARLTDLDIVALCDWAEGAARLMAGPR